jgi:hypothetical protein
VLSEVSPEEIPTPCRLQRAEGTHCIPFVRRNDGEEIAHPNEFRLWN